MTEIRSGRRRVERKPPVYAGLDRRLLSAREAVKNDDGIGNRRARRVGDDTADGGGCGMRRGDPDREENESSSTKHRSIVADT